MDGSRLDLMLSQAFPQPANGTPKIPPPRWGAVACAYPDPDERTEPQEQATIRKLSETALREIYLSPEYQNVKAAEEHQATAWEPIDLKRVTRGHVTSHLREAARNAIRYALKRLNPKATTLGTNIASGLERVFCEALAKQQDKFLAVVRESPSRVVLAKEIADQRRALRQELTNELRGARQRLKDLGTQEQRALQRLHDIQAAASRIATPYPDIPPPTITPTKYGDNLPGESGIYFFWNGGCVQYVGQSINISQRVHLGSHEKLRSDDAIGWVLVPRAELNYAEAFYIGIMKPPRNFGGWYKNIAHASA